jgi:hypothetical protein
MRVEICKDCAQRWYEFPKLRHQVVLFHSDCFDGLWTDEEAARGIDADILIALNEIEGRK